MSAWYRYVMCMDASQRHALQPVLVEGRVYTLVNWVRTCPCRGISMIYQVLETPMSTGEIVWAALICGDCKAALPWIDRDLYAWDARRFIELNNPKTLAATTRGSKAGPSMTLLDLFRARYVVGEVAIEAATMPRTKEKPSYNNQFTTTIA